MTPPPWLPHALELCAGLTLLLGGLLTCCHLLADEIADAISTELTNVDGRP